ncbi:U2 snRNP component IST3 [Striga asiatica]|uniref:U2 snRNP component IST3 n=1 Tax=Striga asiatica TaxID=4170 RepID=A0A5A7P6X8_STRAF|nr:U2 snRNP component IST3 [Striga asiatica]
MWRASISNCLKRRADKLSLDDRIAASSSSAIENNDLALARIWRGQEGVQYSAEVEQSSSTPASYWGRPHQSWPTQSYLEIGNIASMIIEVDILKMKNKFLLPWSVRILYYIISVAGIRKLKKLRWRQLVALIGC